MLTIDRAITEAQAEETAEREVKSTMERKAPAPANMVTLPLAEYINLFNSTDKYCRLVGIIAGLAEPCTYSDGMRISDGEEILNFIKFNEMDVYADMLAHMADIKDLNEALKAKERGEDV